MIQLDIPDFGALRLSHLVSDYNGTLAVDGRLLPGVAEALAGLSKDLAIHVVTADTFGLAASQLAGLPVDLVITPAQGQADAKLKLVQEFGGDTVVALGNGRNDRKMLRIAGLGIAVMQGEGVAGETLAAADVVAPGIGVALDLLAHPKRLLATLRS